MSSSRVTRGEGLSPWPSRLGSWTLVASIPLILFGGTVTTMRAGMAENGWLQPDGYLLWTYPWALRVRSAGVFVEHQGHELFACRGLAAELERFGADDALRRNDFAVRAVHAQLRAAGRPPQMAERAARPRVAIALHHPPARRTQQPAAEPFAAGQCAKDQRSRGVEVARDFNRPVARGAESQRVAGRFHGYSSMRSCPLELSVPQ